MTQGSANDNRRRVVIMIIERHHADTSIEVTYYSGVTCVTFCVGTTGFL